MQETTLKPYSGTGKIIDVVPAKELRYKKGLTDEQLDNALLIVLHIQPDDETFPIARLDIEFSDRECRGNFAGKTQREVSMMQASAAGVIENNDPLTIFDSIGKTVSIYQKISIGTDGREYANTYFASNQNRISKEEAIAKLKRMFASASSEVTVNPSENPFE